MTVSIVEVGIAVAGPLSVVLLGVWWRALISLSEYGVLVPTAFNSGEPVPREMRERIERMMRDRFRGFTAVRGLDGSWVDDSAREYPDVVDEYRLAARSRDAVVSLAHDIGKLLQQRVVYLRCPNNTVVMVHIREVQA
jgi:hypothetical protein